MWLRDMKSHRCQSSFKDLLALVYYKTESVLDCSLTTRAPFDDCSCRLQQPTSALKLQHADIPAAPPPAAMHCSYDPNTEKAFHHLPGILRLTTHQLAFLRLLKVQVNWAH